MKCRGITTIAALAAAITFGVNAWAEQEDKGAKDGGAAVEIQPVVTAGTISALDVEKHTFTLKGDSGSDHLTLRFDNNTSVTHLGEKGSIDHIKEGVKANVTHKAGLAVSVDITG